MAVYYHTYYFRQSQTINAMPDGTKGGDGAQSAGLTVTGGSATGHGNGGGGAVSAGASSGTRTATSGAGSGGVIYIYARRKRPETT